MEETYHVYRDGKKIASNVIEQTYTDTGLKPDTAYHYQVSSENEHGESALSDELIVRTKAIAVSGVTIKPETVSVEEGKTVQLQATVAPPDATNQQVSYTSSDEKVAAVNTSGLVTAVKQGEVTVTVKTADGNHTATSKITVTPKPVPVASVSVTPTTMELEVEKTVQLQTTVAPNDATNKQVFYTSSDDKVAVVNKDGLITAVKPGEAQITVKTQDGNKTATSKITVKAKPVPVASVSVTPTTMELEEGKTQSLKATVKPDNADDKTVTFKSADTSIATVDANGLVKAVKAGKTTVTATAKGDTSKTATCAVTVTAPPAPPPDDGKEKEGK
ncbi:Ig-like domain-containing protein [Bacillus sp. FSL W7-1360]